MCAQSTEIYFAPSHAHHMQLASISIRHASQEETEMLVTAAGGRNARVLHTHFASLGAADAVFEQDAADLATLETQITHLTASPEFQAWSKRMSALLAQSPKREIYIVAQ
jgi:hypothetical protein